MMERGSTMKMISLITLMWLVFTRVMLRIPWLLIIRIHGNSTSVHCLALAFIFFAQKCWLSFSCNTFLISKFFCYVVRSRFRVERVNTLVLLFEEQMANLSSFCSNVGCCCGATIYQTLIERLLMMLQDPDYRVRFSLARRIGVLFQTWDGHEELFHDIWWVSTIISFISCRLYLLEELVFILCSKYCLPQFLIITLMLYIMLCVVYLCICF